MFITKDSIAQAWDSDGFPASEPFLPNERAKTQIGELEVKLELEDLIGSFSPFVDDNETRKWKFHIQSLHQIDFKEIERDLSYKNPVALVEAGEFYYVVVHESLLNKASLIGMLYDTEYSYSVSVFPLDDKAEFNRVIKWAKNVKNAEWPDKHKTEVEVKIPKI